MNRTDKNQKQIEKVLKQLGASVKSTSQLGNGFPDLIIGYKGKTYLVEIKGENSYGKTLRESQIKFKNSWKGSPIIILRTTNDAIEFINNIK